MDLGDDLRDQHVIVAGGARGVDADLLERWPGGADISRTRSASSAASRTLCVTNRNVLGRPWLDPHALELVLEQLPRLRVELRRTARRPAATSGSHASARASCARWRIPADSSCGWAFANRSGARFQPVHRAVVPRSRRARRSAAARIRRSPRRRARGTAPAPGTGPRGRARAPAIGRPSSRTVAGRGLVQPREDVEDGRLAAAGRPQQADELAGGDVEASRRRRRDRVPAATWPRASSQVAHRQLRCDAAPGAGTDVGVAERPSDRRHRSLNFSAISICTTLPSWITSTTVPNWILLDDLGHLDQHVPLLSGSAASWSKEAGASAAGSLATQGY